MVRDPLSSPGRLVCGLTPAFWVRLDERENINKSMVGWEAETSAYMESTKIDGGDGKVCIEINAFGSSVRRMISKVSPECIQGHTGKDKLGQLARCRNLHHQRRQDGWSRWS